MFQIVKRNTQIGIVTVPYKPGASKAPEGFKGAPEINPQKCTGCGQCVPACPTDALSIQDHLADNKRDLFLSYGDCTFCGLCEPACPYEAIEFKGKYELASQDKRKLTLQYPFKLSTCSKDKAFIADFPCPQPQPQENTGLEQAGGQLKDKVDRLFGRSLHIRLVDAGSCNGCEVEINNLSNPIYDVERFGIHFVASPRHADMLLVTGPVTKNMEVALLKTYEATPSPKLVVACGGCAIAGGIFKGSYAIVGGVDKAVPVDVYIPGCPPRPEALLHGIFLALGKIKS